MLAYQYFTMALNKLQLLYTKSEAEHILYWLFEDKLLIKRHYLKIIEKELSVGEELQLNNSLKRLLNAEPIQYILGYAYFFNLVFKVTRDVLIPRPETEELVNLLIKNNQNQTGINILDAGTGSGCIAVSVKKNLPGCNVYATDISPEALAIATYNANYHQTQVTFFKSDLLNINNTNSLINYDIIISNPPYIPMHQAASMHGNVLKYEPHLALFVNDNNPMLYYEKILAFGLSQNPLCKFYFELSETTGHLIEGVAARFNLNAQLIKDIHGKLRFALI